MKRWRMAVAVALGLLSVAVMLAAVGGGGVRLSAAAPVGETAARQVITRTVTLEAARDTTLYGGQGNVSNGGGQHFFAGNTNTDLARRGLLAFDLSAIPPEATIITATLTLNMSKTIADDEPVSLHALAADWGEGDSDALGEEGAGAAAVPGDATWLHTFYDDQFWATPGGDFAASPSATTMVEHAGSYSWASAGLLVDVAGWVADPATNFGWAVLGDETATGTAKRFDSRENETATARPLLMITYAAEEVEGPMPVFVPVVFGE